jgi:hypothetical protein
MGKSFCTVLLLSFSIGPFLTLNVAKDAVAGVHVDIDIGLPSPFVFPAPPPVVVIPGTYVYLIPDIDVSVLFYHGHWYRPHRGRWFRAHSYDGPWVHLAPRHVPRALVKLPPHHRRVPPGYHRVSHGQLEANWGEWERKKHWNKDKKWRAGWKGHKGYKGAEYKHARELQGRPAENKGSVREQPVKNHGDKGNPGRERGRDKHGKPEGRRD